MVVDVIAAVAAVLVVVLTGLTWVVFSRQLSLVCVALFALACAPTIQIPVVHVAVIVPLAMLAVAARFTGRWPFAPPGAIEVGSLALVAASVFPLVGHGLHRAGVQDFVSWTVMTSLVIPLRAMPAAERARAGRAYAWGAGAGAAFALALRLGNPSGSLLPKLSVLGYSAAGDNSRYIVTSGGPVLRLTGAYLDPNLAGLLLTLGLVLAGALLHGSARVAVCLVIASAIALTFSRASIGSVVVAAVLLVLVGTISSRTRQSLVTALLLGAAGAWAVPGVRNRLLESFGSHDVGSSARAAALRNFPDQMSGHWLLGRGFGYPVLTQGAAAVQHADQIPANAVLVTAYRGGLVVAAVFAVLLAVALVRAARMLRSGSEPAAILGAGAVGLVLVALQLDIPVVTIAPGIAALSVLLAFLEPASGTAPAPFPPAGVDAVDQEHRYAQP